MSAALAPLADLPIPSIETLTQNTAKLLQESLAQAMQAASPLQITAFDLELARSNIKALAFVQAIGLHGAYRYMRDFMSRQSVPIYAVEEYLDGWLNAYGLSRKAAALAAGVVTGTGTAGAVLPAGSMLQDSAGLLFATSADATVASSGAWSAQVVATSAGTSSNLVAATDLTLVSSMYGIDLGAQVGTDGLSGGTETETDEEAVYRLSQRLANEPRGGSPEDYARWAMSVTGITRAWGLRCPAGPGTAGVIIMADGNTADGLPTPAMRTAVRDYIRYPRRAPPDELFVVVPTLKVQAFALTIYPDNTATRAAVVASLEDLFFREAVPGGSLPHSHVIEAISTSLGEYNHVIHSPAVASGHAFTSDPFELLTLGVVTFVAA